MLYKKHEYGYGLEADYEEMVRFSDYWPNADGFALVAGIHQRVAMFTLKDDVADGTGEWHWQPKYKADLGSWIRQGDVVLR